MPFDGVNPVLHNPVKNVMRPHLLEPVPPSQPLPHLPSRRAFAVDESRGGSA